MTNKSYLYFADNSVIECGHIFERFSVLSRPPEVDRVANDVNLVTHEASGRGQMLEHDRNDLGDLLLVAQNLRVGLNANDHIRRPKVIGALKKLTNLHDLARAMFAIKVI